MKLLLTSSGLRNQTQRDALHDLLGKPFASANVVFVPTASLAEPGDHSWFVADLNRLYDLGWREFDILELNGTLNAHSARNCSRSCRYRPG